MGYIQNYSSVIYGVSYATTLSEYSYLYPKHKYFLLYLGGRCSPKGGAPHSPLLRVEAEKEEKSARRKKSKDLFISKWGNVSKMLSDTATTRLFAAHSQSRIHPSAVQSRTRLHADRASQSLRGVGGCPAACSAACSVTRPQSVDPPVRPARCSSPARAADGAAGPALSRPRLSAAVASPVSLSRCQPGC